MASKSTTKKSQPIYKLSDLIKGFDLAKKSGDRVSAAAFKTLFDHKDYINDVDDVNDNPPKQATPVVKAGPVVKKEVIIPDIVTVSETKIEVDPLSINLDLFKPTLE